LARLPRVERVAENFDAAKRTLLGWRAFENPSSFARLRDSMQMTVDGGRPVVLAAAARLEKLSNLVLHVVRQHRRLARGR
jgi:hypothetical protein